MACPQEVGAGWSDEVENSVEDGAAVHDGGDAVRRSHARGLQFACRVLTLVVGVSCCGFAVWATVSGELQRWTEFLMDLSYEVVCLIIIGLLVFLNMPFGYGYSVVVIASGFGFGWAALPPVLVGGLLVGPWAAFYLNTRLLFRGKTPDELVKAIPTTRVRCWVRAVLLGIREDKCSVLIVIATRFSPLAMGIQLLVLCAAGPPFWVFALGMFCGGIPDLVLCVYVGTLFRAATDEASKEADEVKFALIVAQAFACIFVMLLVSLAARRMIRKYDRPEVEVTGEDPAEVN